MKKILNIAALVFIMMHIWSFSHGMDHNEGQSDRECEEPEGILLSSLLKEIESKKYPASSHNLVERIKYHMRCRHGFNVLDNQRALYGMTSPLFDAAESDDFLEISHFLVCNDASPNIGTEHGKKPLEHAILNNATETAFWLVCRGADCTNAIPLLIKQAFFHTKSHEEISKHLGLLNKILFRLNTEKSCTIAPSQELTFKLVAMARDDKNPFLKPRISIEGRVDFIFSLYGNWPIPLDDSVRDTLIADLKKNGFLHLAHNCEEYKAVLQNEAFLKQQKL